MSEQDEEKRDENATDGADGADNGSSQNSSEADTGAADTGAAEGAQAADDAAAESADSSTESDADRSEQNSPAAEESDELPEDEELTPELVEEEAIRGDFMLRWAGIFLAVLFGFSQISDSRVLLHIRSGDAMRAGSFLPSSEDTLSYSLDGTSVSNVSWLFDHVVSGVYGTFGEYGLTVFKALAAGAIAYLLSLISLRGMPTWWSSICCALAVAACSVDFVPVTDLATLLGLTVILLLLHRHREGSVTGLVWKIPLTIAIWANFDTHAYMGVLAVGLFTLGSQIQRSLSQQNGDGPVPETGVLWKVAGFSFLALLVNPAPLASLTAFLTEYGIHYDTMSQLSPLLTGNGEPVSTSLILDGRTEYFPLWADGILNGFEMAWVAGFALIVICIVVLVISQSREDLPWAFLFGGFTLLALIALHELPAASLAAAVCAGTAAQRWYGKRFRQEYTVNTSEVLFSRGGRAVTVLAFAALSFFVVADRVPTRSPIGPGFEANLKTTMETLGEQLEDLPEDGNVLHTVMTQGDILVWHGRKSFIDSRVTPFGAYGDEASAVTKFDKFRWSIIRPPSATQNAEGEAGAAGNPLVTEPAEESERPYDPDWRKGLAELGVTHAMIRLAPPGRPAYSMAATLFRSPDWVLSHRGPSALFFGLVKDPKNPPKSISSAVIAFRDSEAEDLEQAEFARPKDFYQTYLYASRYPLNAAMREAQHYLAIDCQIPESTIFQVARAAAEDPSRVELQALLGSALAGPILAIRNANRVIVEDPQNELAHRIRGTAYNRLNQTERAIASAFGGSAPEDTRYLQAVMALRQAATIEPEGAVTWEQLMNLYQSKNRTGLALECLERLLGLIEEDLEADPDAQPQLRQLYEMQRTWQERRDNVQLQIDEFMSQDMPEDPQEHAQQKFEVIRQLIGDGHIRIALNIAEENLDLLRPLPQAELLRGQMLLETGQLEDGSLVLNQLAAVIGENPNHPGFAGIAWHQPVAMSRIARSDYPGATEVWSEQLSVFNDAAKDPTLSMAEMRALPGVPNVETSLGGKLSPWPLAHLQDVYRTTVLPQLRYTPSFLRALADIESGNVINAKFLLNGLISEGGDHQYRPLAAIYLRQMNDEADTLIAESSLDLWEDFEFPSLDEESPESADKTESTP